MILQNQLVKKCQLYYILVKIVVTFLTPFSNAIFVISSGPPTENPVSEGPQLLLYISISLYL